VTETVRATTVWTVRIRTGTGAARAASPVAAGHPGMDPEVALRIQERQCQLDDTENVGGTGTGT